jgi:hypothetical protein
MLFCRFVHKRAFAYFDTDLLSFCVTLSQELLLNRYTYSSSITSYYYMLRFVRRNTFTPCCTFFL